MRPPLHATHTHAVHTLVIPTMSAIAGSVSLSAAKARGLGFKQSAPMGSRVAAAVPAQPRARTERGALKVVAGNDYEGGLFAPIVVVARNVIGVKRFNQIRGKAIALHSQVRARPTDVDATFRHLDNILAVTF